MSEFKVSICSASYGRADLFTIVDRVGAIGYDGVEITVMYHADPAETSAQKRQEIRRHLKNSGVALSALHFIFGPGLKMAADDPKDRARVTESINSVLELAHDLEAPIIVVGGGGVRAVPAALARDVGEQRVLEVLGNSARRAEELGVSIGLEAINRYETNLGRTLGDCKRLVQAMASEVETSLFSVGIDLIIFGLKLQRILTQQIIHLFLCFVDRFKISRHLVWVGREHIAYVECSCKVVALWKTRRPLGVFN